MNNQELQSGNTKVTVTKNNKTALVFGGTGLVGEHLVRELAMHDNYETVKTFGRRKVGLKYPKVEEIVIDFDRLEDYGEEIKGDDLFVCLGTTIKKAGSQAAFRRVDFEYVYRAAQIAAENGVNQLLLISSAGADVNSGTFYSRVKGQIEEAVKKLPFWSLHIFQPSLLIGDRDESRPAEAIGQAVGKFLNKFTTDLFDLYQPVEAENVARAMVLAAQNMEGGVEVHQSHRIRLDGSK